MSIIQQLKELNQEHIIEAYNKATPQQQKNFEAQIKRLNEVYPGGLRNYHKNAVQLLKQSANNSNPFDEYKVGVPNGFNMDFRNWQMVDKYEHLGMKQVQHTAFVLVAGGLGQRLGYPGIKIGIPKHLLTEVTFLQYYIEYMLAVQKRYCPQGHKIPFVIMTSDDTYTKTVQLLEANKYFGMDDKQLIIVKQQKVPAMTDIEARFALCKDKLQIQTKPHGHGDIHTLLYQHKLVEQWQKRGIKWIFYFQDTNPFAFRSLMALLGITHEKDFDFNSIGVPRKPGQAVGAITSLVHKQTGKTLTINVEYNMLQGLFKQSGGEKVDQNGYSYFPGNSNCFIIKIGSYIQALNKTQGIITQFINPKYTDNTNTTFKSSARLQCMMQDYPKLLDNCDKVGFTMIEKGFCFTAAKNDPASAAQKFKSGLSPQSAGSCQGDINFYNRVMLRMCGAEIEQGEPVQFGGIKIPLYPMVSISPWFSTCLTQMKHKVQKLKMTKESSLILGCDCILEDVQIDGHVQISEQGGNIKMKNDNKNYKQVVHTQGHEEPHLLIRKFKIIK